MWNDSVSVRVQNKKYLLQVEKSSFLPVSKSMVNTHVLLGLREHIRMSVVDCIVPSITLAFYLPQINLNLG